MNEELLALLEGLGVEMVEALGKEFDANDHEAVQMQESLEYGDQMVCVQYQRGYRVGGRLVRPALVVVSSGPGPSTVAPEASGGAGGGGGGGHEEEGAGQEPAAGSDSRAEPGAGGTEEEGGDGSSAAAKEVQGGGAKEA